jgi:hypothetical protein
MLRAVEGVWCLFERVLYKVIDVVRSARIPRLSRVVCEAELLADDPRPADGLRVATHRAAVERDD